MNKLRSRKITDNILRNVMNMNILWYDLYKCTSFRNSTIKCMCVSVLPCSINGSNYLSQLFAVQVLESFEVDVLCLPLKWAEARAESQISNAHMFFWINASWHPQEHIVSVFEQILNRLLIKKWAIIQARTMLGTKSFRGNDKIIQIVILLYCCMIWDVTCFHLHWWV